MKKIITILIILIVAVSALLFYINTRVGQLQEADEEILTLHNNPKLITDSNINSKKSFEDGVMRFLCDGDKAFQVQLIQADKSSNVSIKFDENDEPLVLVQSSSSAHWYESSDKKINFYAEGDEASAEKNGEKYQNCVAAK